MSSETLWLFLVSVSLWQFLSVQVCGAIPEVKTINMYLNICYYDINNYYQCLDEILDLSSINGMSDSFLPGQASSII